MVMVDNLKNSRISFLKDLILFPPGDITKLDGTLANLNLVETVSYNWRADEFPDKNFDTSTHIGFIAQQVEPIFPELVHTDEDGYKAISYQNMTAILTSAFNELTGIIDLTDASRDFFSLTIDADGTVIVKKLVVEEVVAGKISGDEGVFNKVCADEICVNSSQLQKILSLIDSSEIDLTGVVANTSTSTVADNNISQEIAESGDTNITNDDEGEEVASSTATTSQDISEDTTTSTIELEITIDEFGEVPDQIGTVDETASTTENIATGIEASEPLTESEVVQEIATTTEVQEIDSVAEPGDGDGIQGDVIDNQSTHFLEAGETPVEESATEEVDNPTDGDPQPSEPDDLPSPDDQEPEEIASDEVPSNAND